MPHTFTTLRHPAEKLFEAEHFLARMICSHGLKFQFELNAFLSASRSVTFLLQKSMSEVPGFSAWYGDKQALMRLRAVLVFLDEPVFESKLDVAGAEAGWSASRTIECGGHYDVNLAILDHAVVKLKGWKKARGSVLGTGAHRQGIELVVSEFDWLRIVR